MPGSHTTHNPSKCLGQKVKERYREGTWAPAPGSLSTPEGRSPFSVIWRSCSSGAWLGCCDRYTSLRSCISSRGWSDPSVELVSSLEFVRELNAVLEQKRHYRNENCYSLLIKVKRFSCFILSGGKQSVKPFWAEKQWWLCEGVLLFFVAFLHLSMYHPIIASSLPVSRN